MIDAMSFLFCAALPWLGGFSRLGLIDQVVQRQVAEVAGVRFGGTFSAGSLSKPNGPALLLLDFQRHSVRLLLQGLKTQGQQR